jgi:hypothetical protein
MTFQRIDVVIVSHAALTHRQPAQRFIRPFDHLSGCLYCLIAFRDFLGDLRLALPRDSHRLFRIGRDRHELVKVVRSIWHGVCSCRLEGGSTFASLSHRRLREEPLPVMPVQRAR